MSVRQYKADDSTNVKNLILAILEKEYPFDKSAYRDTDINDITGTYSGEKNAFFVAEKDKNIVGTIGVKSETDNRALIRRFFVSESERHHGLGTGLLNKAIDFCKEKDYKEITFRATDRMKDAMKLFKKMGFKETEDLEVSGFHIHRFMLKL